MKLLTKYIIKEHIPPFFFSLAVIVFIFLINFIIKSIDKIIGKGIPAGIILEYISFNLAWIFALAIPMSVLVSTLMAFGRLASDNETTALRSSGVNFYKIISPALLLSIFIGGFLIYFNNAILPDFNHRARLLGSDIYRKRPDLNVEPGYFIDDLPDYTLLVKEKEKDLMKDILIYSKNNQKIQTTIKAKTGKITIKGDKVILYLYNGVIHELNFENVDEYRKISFEKHKVTIPVSNMILQRSFSERRGDREMSAPMMLNKIKELRKRMENVRKKINTIAMKQYQRYVNENKFPEKTTGKIPESKYAEPKKTLLAGTGNLYQTNLKNRIKNSIRRTNNQIKTEINILESYQKQINRYMVEVHKKFSIPAASIVFILIGAPLGVLARKGGIAVGGSLSIGFFLIYWAFLIAGEELADRSYVSPFWAMWTPNIILGAAGAYMVVRTVRERTIINWKIMEKIFPKNENKL